MWDQKMKLHFQTSKVLFNCYYYYYYFSDWNLISNSINENDEKKGKKEENFIYDTLLFGVHLC